MRIDRFRFWPALTALGIQAGVLASAQEADRDFKPELAAVEFTSRQVRPGKPWIPQAVLLGGISNPDLYWRADRAAYAVTSSKTSSP